MFLTLNPCFLLLITILVSLVLSLPLVTFLVALLLVLHMTRYTSGGLLLAIRLGNGELYCN
jgi:hypothetical protein